MTELTARALFDSLFAGIILCQLIRWVPQAKKDNRVVQVLVTFGSMAALTTTIFTWANYLMSFIYDFGRFADFISFESESWSPILGKSRSWTDDSAGLVFHP
jgi:hypothetical protein